MAKATRKIKPYKSTGNPAIDMVAACINHCERYGKRIAEIRLNHKYWRMFCEGVKRLDETIDTSDNEVNFDNVTVRKGTMFQTKQLTYDLVKDKPLIAV